MEKLEKFLNKKYWLIIILLSIPAIWALLVPGFFGASDDIHIAWLYEMNQAIGSGQFPPRFIPDLSFGFGYPLFDFVFPLPFYFGELFHMLGFSFVDSVKIVFLLTIPFSIYTMYKLLREFSGPLLSLAGALLYGYTPYRSSDIYVRGAFGEALPFVFMPLLALSFIKISTTDERKKRIAWIGLGSISLASLVLSHDITAYMFFPAVLLLAILLIVFNTKNKLSSAISLAVSIALGLLSSIYFWLPALLESKLVKYDTVFNFVDHFPTLKQLIIPFFGFGASVPGPNDGLSFFIGTINLFVLVISSFILFYCWKKFKKIEQIILCWSLIIFVVAFFMMNNRSIFLWDHLPLIPYFQFPWRFLILTTFTTPILVITFEKLKISKVGSLVLIALVLTFNWYYFRPHDFLGRQDAYYLNRYIPTPFPSLDYMQTQEEYLRLPASNETRPRMLYPRVFPQTDAVVSVNTFNALNAEVETSSVNPLTLSYNKYLFPGWDATIDGQPLVLTPGKPFGQISFNVPSGNHTIDIFYTEPADKEVLDYVSLVCCILALGFILQLKLKWRKR